MWVRAKPAPTSTQCVSPKIKSFNNKHIKSDELRRFLCACYGIYLTDLVNTLTGVVELVERSVTTGALSVDLALG